MDSVKPTTEKLLAARGGTLRDLVRPGLKVVFCGINPSLYSVAVGHHFARPGNRFWGAIHLAGFTERRLSPQEDAELLYYGYGLTNMVPRGTATAAELTASEYIAGGKKLAAKLRRYRPQWLAVLGVEAFRRAFERPAAGIGPQPDKIGTTRVWVLPNPSGLNAHYQLAELAEAYAELRKEIG